MKSLEKRGICWQSPTLITSGRGAPLKAQVPDARQARYSVATLLIASTTEKVLKQKVSRLFSFPKIAHKIELDHMFDHLAKQNRIEQPKSSLFRIFRQMRACSICIRLRPPSPKSIKKFLLLDTLRIRYNLPPKSCSIRSCSANGFCTVFICLEWQVFSQKIKNSFSLFTAYQILKGGDRAGHPLVCCFIAEWRFSNKKSPFTVR
ncbi:MAG: hypothetical protein IJD77_06285 [Clostridia bacterium]|nr:hypothetical protein [Clostridia bacterium]